MTRSLRIEYPNAWYHVTSRGNQKSSIFYANKDRRKFLKLLGESSQLFQVEVHGYVLLDNHFHLLVKTPLANLSRFMQQFNTAYTVNFNKMHQRVGHLFQGRYKAILVDADSYLKELSRYIHLNPVRLKQFDSASIKEKIEILNYYPWSSYSAYAGKKKAYPFLHRNMILNMFGKSRYRASRGYRRFVLDGLEKGIPDPLRANRANMILGSGDFVKTIYANYIDRVIDKKEFSHLDEAIPPLQLNRIAEEVAAEFGLRADSIIKRRAKPIEARQILIELCFRYLVKDLNLRSIGEMLGGIRASAFKMNRKRLEERLKDNIVLGKQFSRIKDRILSD